MDAERWSRIESLFEGAVGLPAAERAGWLAARCGTDEALQREVERLLAADAVDSHGDVVDRMDRGTLLAARDPLLGTDLGAWRLVERLAAGGMGVVYRAARADGLFDQEVAIKLLRADLASDRLAQRFAFERRTLAALEHPGIARVLDGGTSADGRPYLTMELVRGVPIDRYCETHGLGLTARLRLLIAICAAVQFAHNQLVVHRDLKPANILIDARGQPKLVDFGIARLLDAADSDVQPTLVAQATPEYASPGQLSGQPASTADDIYSLGVVAYEILTGERPFRAAGRDPLTWHRDVTETTPTRPSVTLSPRDPDLARRLRGDLDRIVLMALRKEPERRYPSARALAEDFERHLAGRPVRARGDSLGYRASRFVARHRLGVATAAMAVAAVAFGFVAAVRGERLAAEEALHARVEAESSQELADFLIEHFLAGIDPDDRSQVVRRRQQLLDQAQRVRQQYAEQPHQRANLLDSLGQVAGKLGLDEVATGLLTEALGVREEAFGASDIECSRSLLSLGRFAYARGEYAAAAERLERGLAIQRSTLRGPHTNIHAFANDLAACRRALGDLDAAEALLREALRIRLADGAVSLPVAESLNNLAGVVSQRGDFDAAAELLARSHHIREQVLGERHVLTVQSLANRAVIAGRRGHESEASRLLAEAERGYRALESAGLDGLAQVLHNRGWLAARAGEAERAFDRLDEARRIHAEILPAGHPRSLATLAELLTVADSLGRDADARQVLAELAAAYAANQGEGSPNHLRTTIALAERLLAAGERDAARAAAERALPFAEAGPEPELLDRARAVLAGSGG